MYTGMLIAHRYNKYVAHQKPTIVTGLIVLHAECPLCEFALRMTRILFITDLAFWNFNVLCLHILITSLKTQLPVPLSTDCGSRSMSQQLWITGSHRLQFSLRRIWAAMLKPASAVAIPENSVETVNLEFNIVLARTFGPKCCLMAPATLSGQWRIFLRHCLTAREALKMYCFISCRHAAHTILC